MHVYTSSGQNERISIPIRSHVRASTVWVLSVRAILPRGSKWVDYLSRDTDIWTILLYRLAVSISATGVSVDALRSRPWGLAF